MKPLIDIEGEVFGSLTVLGRAPRVRWKTMWRCRCKCGEERAFSGRKLRANRIKSCGCSRVAGIKAFGVERTIKATAPANVARKRKVSLLRERRWKKNNPERSAANNGRNSARRRAAVPLWANLSEIDAIYAEARRLQLSTGIRMSVDHIIPIKGKNVCGLHVPNNLRVMPLTDNIRKGNRAS